MKRIISDAFLGLSVVGCALRTGLAETGRVVVAGFAGRAQADVVGAHASGGVVGVDHLRSAAWLALSGLSVEAGGGRWAGDRHTGLLGIVDVLLRPALLALALFAVKHLGLGVTRFAGRLLCLSEHLVPNTLLAGLLLPVEYLIGLADSADLLPQVVKRPLWAADAPLFQLNDIGCVDGAGGEVEGGAHLEHLYLVVAGGGRPVVPVLGCEVVLEVGVVDVDQSLGLVAQVPIAEVTVKGLVNKPEVVFSLVQEGLGLISYGIAGVARGYQLCQLGLVLFGVGQVLSDCGAVEGGNPSAVLVHLADDQSLLLHVLLEQLQPRRDFLGDGQQLTGLLVVLYLEAAFDVVDFLLDLDELVVEVELLGALRLQVGQQSTEAMVEAEQEEDRGEQLGVVTHDLIFKVSEGIGDADQQAEADQQADQRDTARTHTPQTSRQHHHFDCA